MFLCFTRTKNQIRRLQEIRIDLSDSLNRLVKANKNLTIFSLNFLPDETLSGITSQMIFCTFRVRTRATHTLSFQYQRRSRSNLPLHLSNLLYPKELWWWRRHQRIAFVGRVALSPGRLDLRKSAFSLFYLFFSLLFRFTVFHKVDVFQFVSSISNVPPNSQNNSQNSENSEKKSQKSN